MSKEYPSDAERAESRRISLCEANGKIDSLQSELDDRKVEVEGLQEQNRELRGDHVAGIATKRVLAAAHEKIEELELDKKNLEEIESDNSMTIGFMQRGLDERKVEVDGLEAKLDKAVGVLKRITQYQDSSGKGMKNIATEALTATRKEESIKIRPMPDKCTICFAHPRMIASCKHCNGTGKEPK